MEGHPPGFNPESEKQTSPDANQIDWERQTKIQLGQESAEDINEIRKSWKQIGQKGDEVAYDTGGGIFVENKATGRLTRVADSIGEVAAAGKKR